MARPTSLKPEHLAATDVTKTRRRRMVNALVGGLSARAGGLVEFNRMRTRITGLPGNGLLLVHGRTRGDRLYLKYEEARDEDERSPGGWVGVMHETTKIGPVVTLPLSAFLSMMQQMEEQQ